VHEREKRKAKEVATFFFVSYRISDQKGGKRTFLYYFLTFYGDAQLTLRAVSRRSAVFFEGRDGRVRVREENTRAHFKSGRSRDDFAVRLTNWKYLAA